MVYEEIHGKYWESVHRGAVHRGLPFEITIEHAWELFLKQGRKCALSGVPIQFATTWSKKERGEASASLDRIDSTQGYVTGNVQWLHKDVNRMKQAFPEDKFIEYCQLIAKEKGGCN